MRSRIFALVSAVAAAGIMASTSCSTSPLPPASSEATVSAKPYGSVTLGTQLGTAGSLSPPKMVEASWKYVVALAIFDPLVLPTIPDRQMGPGIAERWEISPDGLTQTFYIRKGVKFHDGSDLTGADVKFSLERSLSPDFAATASSHAATWRAAIASIELKDDFTMVLRMKQPQYELLTNADTPISAVMPKKYVEEKGEDYAGKHPIGSGPFKFVSEQPGLRVDLEANEDYWGEIPKFKNLAILSIPEESTRVNMLKTGELDVAEISPDSVADLKSAGLKVSSYDAGRQIFGFMFYDVEHPEKQAFGDVRVRKALFWAINRQEMIDKLLGGNGALYALMRVGPKADFFDPNVLKPDPYDPEGAKRLLAEAGYSNGFDTTLWNERGTFLGMINEAIAGYWRRLGVRGQVKNITVAALNPMWSPKQTPEVWNTVRMHDGGLEGLGFEGMPSIYHSKKGAPKNTNNPKLDELIDKYPQIANPAEKKKIGLEAAVLAYNEYTVLRVVGANMLIGLGPKVGQIAPVRWSVLHGVQLPTITHAQ